MYLVTGCKVCIVCTECIVYGTVYCVYRVYRKGAPRTVVFMVAKYSSSDVEGRASSTSPTPGHMSYVPVVKGSIPSSGGFFSKRADM